MINNGYLFLLRLLLHSAMRHAGIQVLRPMTTHEFNQRFFLLPKRTSDYESHDQQKQQPLLNCFPSFFLYSRTDLALILVFFFIPPKLAPFCWYAYDSSCSLSQAGGIRCAVSCIFKLCIFFIPAVAVR